MSLSLLIDRMHDAVRVLNTVSTPARRRVGGGVVVDDRHRLLMAYSDFAFQGWHFPKGGLDEGESTLEGALREVEEESGGVIARPYSGNVVFELKAGKVYSEPLGFGSPRTERLPERRGPKISGGAAQLLVEAAAEARIDPADFERHRDTIFDTLHERGLMVHWVTVPTYHLMVFHKGTHGPTSESEAVEWHHLEEIPHLRPPKRPNGPPRIGGAARTILELPGFAEMVRSAGQEAQADREK